jgi:8-oxo-dGTP pyrophosphatase MutT (NUDIX family)
VQLPAGTVEANEAPETAVLREAAEETGLRRIRLVRHLGSLSQDLADGWRLVLGQTPLWVGPVADALRLNFTLSRGSWVKVTQQAGDFSEVVWEEYDLNAAEPAILARLSAWLPSKLLTDRLERHFFHLTPTIPTPETWEIRSDGGRLFQLYWTPLDPKPQLVAGQNEWLDFSYERLLSSVAKINE